MNKKIICILLLMASVLSTLVLLDSEEQRLENLYVYTWADYIDPELISRFEKDNNCKVSIDTFDSNETMYAKLSAGSTGYDIVMPTEYFMPLLVKKGLVDRIDMSKLPNVKRNFDERFSSEWSLVWNVPYAFSCTGILWRKDKVPSDLKFEDWNDMFDSRISGGICIMNDIREILGIALKMNGKSVNSTNADEIAEATKLAKRWKARCTKMDNESYRTGIPSAEFHVAMSYNSDAIQLIADGEEALSFAIPTNGVPSSVDVMCITRTSKNKELAHRFIDMLYEMENAVKNSEYNAAPMTVKGLYEALSDEYKKIPFMDITEEIKGRCENIRDVGDSIELYSKAWDEIKSSKQ